MPKIRDYKAQDHEDLIKMISRVLEEFSMSIDKNGTDSELEHMAAVYGRDNAKFYVMEAGGRIIGSVGVRGIDKDTCELRKLYLLKEFRGLGLGRELLRHALTFSVNKGYKKIQLEVSAKHEQAMRLYEKAGFVKTDEKPSCSRCEFTCEKKLPSE